MREVTDEQPPGNGSDESAIAVKLSREKVFLTPATRPGVRVRLRILKGPLTMSVITLLALTINCSSG